MHISWLIYSTHSRSCESTTPTLHPLLCPEVAQTPTEHHAFHWSTSTNLMSLPFHWSIASSLNSLQKLYKQYCLKHSRSIHVKTRQALSIMSTGHIIKSFCKKKKPTYCYSLIMCTILFTLLVSIILSVSISNISICKRSRFNK